jgi:hypothetical protein
MKEKKEKRRDKIRERVIDLEKEGKVKRKNEKSGKKYVEKIREKNIKRGKRVKKKKRVGRR